MTRSSSPAHDRAHKFPGMIGCFRAAPNSGPTSKSLPGPQFSFGLDLCIVVTWCWQIKSWDEIMASQQTDCYGPVVTHCQNAEVWCSFRLTAEVKHKSASPCRDLLTSHQQCKYVNSAIPLGWRALKTPTAQTPGFCGHVTPLTLHYLWPRPPGVWLGGPGCKPGHSRGP